MARYMFFSLGHNPKYVSLWICQYESQSYIFVYDATALCPLGIMQTCIKSQHNIDEFLWQLNLACLTDEIFCNGFLLCLIVFCLKSIERKKLVWYLLWWEYWAYTLKALCTCKMSLKWRFFLSTQSNIAVMMKIFIEIASTYLFVPLSWEALC